MYVKVFSCPSFPVSSYLICTPVFSDAVFLNNTDSYDNPVRYGCLRSWRSPENQVILKFWISTFLVQNLIFNFVRIKMMFLFVIIWFVTSFVYTLCLIFNKFKFPSISFSKSECILQLKFLKQRTTFSSVRFTLFLENLKVKLMQ